MPSFSGFSPQEKRQLGECPQVVEHLVKYMQHEDRPLQAGGRVFQRADGHSCWKLGEKAALRDSSCRFRMLADYLYQI